MNFSEVLMTAKIEFWVFYILKIDIFNQMSPTNDVKGKKKVDCRIYL